MKKKKKSSPDKHSESPSKKDEDENPDMENLNPDDPYDETKPTVKKKPITSGNNHPHQEELLDSTLK